MSEPDTETADLDEMLESVSTDLRQVVAIANVVASAAQSERMPPDEESLTLTAETIGVIGARAIATLERVSHVVRQRRRASKNDAGEE